MKKNVNVSLKESIPKSETEWKNKLTEEQYHILREKGTEAPFSGKLLYLNQQGTYVCAGCGNPLFDSKAKFDSKTGWPSFDQSIPHAIKEVWDQSFGLNRVEIVCAKCNSHLGHFFKDGPTSTGKRYCTNSLSLDFKVKT